MPRAPRAFSFVASTLALASAASALNDQLESSRLTPSTGAWFYAYAVSLDGDRFGQSVVLRGDTLVVGAPEKDDVAAYSGATYVLERRGTTWVPRGKLAHGLGFHDYFGYALALDGETLAVGSENGESVHVYRRSGIDWTLEAVLDGPPGPNEFGIAVAVDGDRMVVGAPREGDASRGAAYVYERGSTWTLDARLASSSSAGAGLGHIARHGEARRPAFLRFLARFGCAAPGALPPSSASTSFFGAIAR